MVIVPKLGMITIVEIEAELMNNFKLGELSKSELTELLERVMLLVRRARRWRLERV